MPVTATPRTHSQLAGELGLCSGRKGRRLFMPHRHPLDFLVATDGVGHRVQAVADNAVNALDARLLQSVDELLCNRIRHGWCLSKRGKVSLIVSSDTEGHYRLKPSVAPDLGE